MAEGTATNPHTYPQGVPCWIDTAQPDPPAASRFYGELLGWSFHEAMPPGAPGSYLIAQRNGKDAAAIAPLADAATGGASAEWVTYIAVDDADAMAARAEELGGALLEPPQDAGPGGRYATVRDPSGAVFRLWQARRRIGSQINNTPGSWNFSDLHVPDVAAALGFYRELFGWTVADMGPDAGAMIGVPGYGDHLESTVDPDIRVRQADAPPGFADVIGGAVVAADGESPNWHVTFSVADRDASAAEAERLGGVVLARAEGVWAATARIRDPWGAEFTLSQFTGPAD
jgi:uncharacterized protein